MMLTLSIRSLTIATIELVFTKRVWQLGMSLAFGMVSLQSPVISQDIAETKVVEKTDTQANPEGDILDSDSGSSLEETSLDDILNAWTARERIASAVKLDFITRKERAGKVVENASRHTHDPNGSSHSHGSSERKTVLTLSGQKMKYELFDILSGVEKIHHRSSYDGKTSLQDFFPPNGTSTHYSNGYIYLLERCDDALAPQTLPVRWAFSISDLETSGIPIHSLVVKNERYNLGGTECIVLEGTHWDVSVGLHGGKVVDRYFVDPQKGYSILRFTQGRRLQVDCSYRFDSEFQCWVPEEWTSQRLQGASTNDVVRSTVSTFEILPDFASDDFNIRFLPGTLVCDNTRSVDNRLGSYCYLVKKDGSEREITWDERSASYEELLATASGMAGKTEDESLPR